MDLSKNLKKVREKKGMSVLALAKKTGISQPYLRQLEMSVKKNPSAAVLQKLAVALGVTVADLLGSPLDISQDALKAAPKSLQALVKMRGEELGLRQEDVEMLKTIHYRGNQPSRLEDWELIFHLIKRILE